MEKYRFYFALFMSLLIHSFLVAFFSAGLGKVSVKKEASPLEVTYQIEKAIQVQKDPAMDTPPNRSIVRQQPPSVASKKEEFLAVKGKVSDLSRIKAPFESSKTFQKGPITDLKGVEEAREIVVPALTVEKMTNPKYATYKENIRKKIKERAYQYIQNPAFESGEVYMSFILLANGTLKQSKVIEEKTKANAYLRAISLKSIEESNPFPPFPADLNYPELTFSVPISFRINQ